MRPAASLKHVANAMRHQSVMCKLGAGEGGGGKEREREEGGGWRITFHQRRRDEVFDPRECSAPCARTVVLVPCLRSA